ncbi:hypothetical protein [Oleidesulfovibrio alaskensis]
MNKFFLGLVASFLGLLLYYLVMHRIEGPQAIYKYSFLIVAMFSLATMVIQTGKKAESASVAQKSEASAVSASATKESSYRSTACTFLICVIFIFSFSMFLKTW